MAILPSIFGHAHDRDKALAHAEKMDAYANNMNVGNDFSRMKAAEWRDKSLQEACEHDAEIR